jgi:transcriptional regulator with XRE-family HTH domain
MDGQDWLAQLGSELDRLRAEKGWTVHQLATRCKLSRTTVSQALNTKKKRPIPTIDTVVRICGELDVDHKPLLELRNRGHAAGRLPSPGPRARDSSRQFTRENNESSSAELTGYFDPLRRENLERSVQWALEAAPAIPLARESVTKGGGLYALYYSGSHELYRAVSSKGSSVPLYVGTAASGRHRIGSIGGSPRAALRSALKYRRQAIDQCEDLDLLDFQVRYLPVEDLWIPGAESLMLGDHHPVWNTIAPGLGNRGPGIGQRNERRSAWDELHPGRSWATKLTPCRRSVEDLRIEILQHFAEPVDRPD